MGWVGHVSTSATGKMNKRKADTDLSVSSKRARYVGFRSSLEDDALQSAGACMSKHRPVGPPARRSKARIDDVMDALQTAAVWDHPLFRHLNLKHVKALHSEFPESAIELSMQEERFLSMNKNNGNNWAKIGLKPPVGLRCSTAAMDSAAQIGNLEVLKWLLEKKKELYEDPVELCTTDAMDLAASNGHLDVMKWLQDHRKEIKPYGPICTSYAAEHAARRGHLDVVKWCHSKRKKFTPTAMNFAAMAGHLTVVEFLHKKRKEGCTVNAMNYAAKNGHLDVVKWLHVHRTEGCTPMAVKLAASNGHLEVVKWLHENVVNNWSREIVESQCCRYALEEAAKNGHLSVVQWLYFNIPFELGDIKALQLAAENGHLETVQWVGVRSCSLQQSLAMQKAMNAGHLHVVMWFHEQGIEFPDSSFNTWFRNAKKSGVCVFTK